MEQTIVVTLTEAQYKALESAVAAHSPQGARKLALLDRAWDRIATAWQRAVDGF